MGIESIFICGNDESQAKIIKVHNFNFSQATKALIYNTRAGELPLTPKQIKKVIIYEEELLPESRDTLNQKEIVVISCFFDSVSFKAWVVIIQINFMLNRAAIVVSFVILESDTLIQFSLVI